jgi:hypothetical protein
VCKKDRQIERKRERERDRERERARERERERERERGKKMKICKRKQMNVYVFSDVCVFVSKKERCKESQ